jgi:hypothetical protein
MGQGPTTADEVKMMFGVSLLVCLVLLLLGAQAIAPTAAGLPGHAENSFLVNLLCGISIFAGIVSSIMFDRFDRRFSPQTAVFRKSDLLVASIVSPLVFLGFYPLLLQAQDPILQVLLAYQNGFVFQNVIARVRGESRPMSPEGGK